MHPPSPARSESSEATQVGQHGVTGGVTGGVVNRSLMLCNCNPPKLHLMGTRCRDCCQYAFTPPTDANKRFAEVVAKASGPLLPMRPQMPIRPQMPQMPQMPMRPPPPIPPIPPPPLTRMTRVEEVVEDNDRLLDAPHQPSVEVDEEARKKRAESASKYTKILVNGTEGNPGIMRSRNKAGQFIEPMQHQRRTVKAFSKRSTTFLGLFDDAGLGKTATALQCIAAEKLMLGRMPKVLISVPVAVLRQWEDAIAEWLRIPPDRVLVTNQLKKVTNEALESHDVVVVTKDLVSKAYRTCFSKQEHHHTIQTSWGQRWVSDWDRIPGAPLHPLYGVLDKESREVESCCTNVAKLREQLAELRRQHSVATNVAGASGEFDADVLALESQIEKREDGIDAAVSALHRARSESTRTSPRKFDVAIYDEGTPSPMHSNTKRAACRQTQTHHVHSPRLQRTSCETLTQLGRAHTPRSRATPPRCCP